MTPEAWLFRNSILPTRDAPARLASHQQVRIDLCLLARDSSSTLQRHLLLLRHGWPGGKSPWRRILVADLGSSDNTCQIAEEAGATLLAPENPRAAESEPSADGDGLQRALEHSDADILLVAPANVLRLEMDSLATLALSLVERPELALCQGASSVAGSELSLLGLRPLLAALCPPLAVFSDPASPLLAVRPDKIRDLPLAKTGGYEAALVVDCWFKFGLSSLSQVLTGSLEWHDRDPRSAPSHSFRSQLALLEALRRAGRLHTNQEFGHLLPVPQEWSAKGPRILTQMEVFPWLRAPGN
ncbi:MAG: hypothetical protein IPK50_19130 [Fibrobacterota bacterium]|nr:hypothetical protein [Fibrobacterota bacterium]QQS04379.1 MAG: hypothetical protein IPK50_19130 [Fibrobacterota bacterium]